MITMRPLLFLLLAVAMTVSLPIQDGQENDSRQQLLKESFTKVATKLREFSQAASRLSSDHLMPSCGICSWAAGSVLKDIRRGLSEEVIADNLDHECKLFGIAGSGRVCDGLVSNFKDEFFYVMKRTTLSAHEVCSSVLGQECGDKGGAQLDHRTTQDEEARTRISETQGRVPRCSRIAKPCTHVHSTLNIH
ncbi:hypothetical protein MTO96_038706 [Rhipicephalus appendiculatus]